MSLTEADLRVQMEQLFAVIDTNRNGKLEKSEVRQFTLDLHNQTKPGQPFDEDGFENHFENLDKNDDMTVSKQELFESLVERAARDGTLRQ